MTPLEVKELVAWLLCDGHFKYGGIDVEVCVLSCVDYYIG